MGQFQVRDNILEPRQIFSRIRRDGRFCFLPLWLAAAEPNSIRQGFIAAQQRPAPPVSCRQGQPMLRSPIVRLVELCTRHAWPVIALSAALACLCAVYTARHFAIATDIKQLFPTELPWAQRAYQFMGAFPQRDTLAVVDA